ncbi:hypothetical protein LJR027_002269 [Terrabacter sp. LjRoot27]|uniref:hypothetical protein n=1 Tax=Terrabacter sp. LjRoot27 TaxID=3342306 RepID=UPI003ECC7479
MGADDLEELLARALRVLVDYIDEREDTFTADDDVRALEEVAAVLHEVSPASRDRLRTLLGPKLSFEVGLSE